MSDRIRKLEQAIAALESKGKSCRSLESQLRQLIRDNQRSQGRVVKQAAQA